MTTIAYKDGIIAYDSRMTSAGMILTDSKDKKTRRENTTFFLSGATCDYDDFISAFLGDMKSDRYLDVAGFAVADGIAIHACMEDDKAEGDDFFRIWYDRLDSFTEGYAIGSGWKFAIAYMRLGKSAAESVELTKAIDAGTGGEVRIFSVADGY